MDLAKRYVECVEEDRLFHAVLPIMRENPEVTARDVQRAHMVGIDFTRAGRLIQMARTYLELERAEKAQVCPPPGEAPPSPRDDAGRGSRSPD